ncbi:hypothetical protein ATANTOWER_024556, partial [Ataeniobius toweri]|nr:hypothetical protein [Ataeniobius toweri]
KQFSGNHIFPKLMKNSVIYCGKFEIRIPLSVSQGEVSIPQQQGKCSVLAHVVPTGFWYAWVLLSEPGSCGKNGATEMLPHTPGLPWKTSNLNSVFNVMLM